MSEIPSSVQQSSLTYQPPVLDNKPRQERSVTGQSLQGSSLFVLQLLTLQEVFLDEALGPADNIATHTASHHCRHSRL